MREFSVRERQVATYSPWQNYAENGVRTLKFRAARIIEDKGVPLVFWDHLVEYVASLNHCIVHRTPFEVTLGRTQDISHLIGVWCIKPNASDWETSR